MSIEELVKKQIAQYKLSISGSTAQIIRDALTEQAEVHAMEIKVYDHMGQHLAREVENLNGRVRELEAMVVPDEPTVEMQAAGACAIRIDTTAINKLWTANAVYRAMLAAAPWPKEGE